MNHTRAYDTSARLSTPTARSIRSSAKWSALPDFPHDDNAQAKLDKLDALLAQSFTPPQDAALLADMLSLPNDGRYPTLELDATAAAAEERWKRLLRKWRRWSQAKSGADDFRGRALD